MYKQSLWKFLTATIISILLRTACTSSTAVEEPTVTVTEEPVVTVTEEVEPTTEVEVTVDPTTDPLADVQAEVAQRLEADVFAFQLVTLDMPTLVEGISAEIIELPFVDRDNGISTQGWPIRPIQLRADGLTEGVLRMDESSETVTLPPEQNYRFGECAENLEEFANCGGLTILDEEQTMMSGMFISEDLGITFFEPVDILLGGRQYPGLHVFYNMAGTFDVTFDDDEQPAQEDSTSVPDQRSVFKVAPITQAQQVVVKSTSIVLDGDVTFYEIDKSTVWSRQESVFNNLALIYGLIEPLSVESPNTATWGLSLTIKGQEVWVSGGPTSTNGTTLINELVDSNYLLLTSVNDDELHYLFVGYSVSGLFGKAAGIGTAAGGFGSGAGLNHAFGDGRSSSSFKTHWVVMTHEIGHLLGGIHEDGVINGCTTWLVFFQICGNSIMPAGSAGAPSSRAAFFSDDNDANIFDVLNALP